MKESIIKKLLTVVLMITYMAAAVGFTFSLHYCGGHYKHISFSSDTEKGCCGKNEHKSHCCKDNVVKAKIKDNHSYSVKVLPGSALSLHDLPCYPVRITAPIFNSRDEELVANDTSPPFERTVPIYLANRVLRI